MTNHSCDVAIIGAGIVGIATAYYLAELQPELHVVLIDAAQPMGLTSAQSGENYRNWWPHPCMAAFTDHSISLMESIARRSNNAINMTRRGYVLATRSQNTDQLIEELISGYKELGNNDLRIHDRHSASQYSPAHSAQWTSAPSGVDVINNPALIEAHFPYYDSSVHSLVHIRRAGDISAQQMGQFMLERFKHTGGKRVTGQVCAIDCSAGFRIFLEDTRATVHSDRVINAAGPFINDIARMLGTQLPVVNILQQKIAFADSHNAIPRDMPFSIDMDAQTIAWTDEERELLAAESETSWLTREMPGAIHCRPDGGDNGNWVKLGWAYNNTDSPPALNPDLQYSFPEIVIRGASRLNPALLTYVEQHPEDFVHYGGYYTMTEENWPLIGPMDIDGTFVVGAMSGFGTMAACAGGQLCAQWVIDTDKPNYAQALSLQRHQDVKLMDELYTLNSLGLL